MAGTLSGPFLKSTSALNVGGGGLPWEDAGGGSNQAILATGKLSSLLTTLGGWWWDKRSGITIGTGVSAWVDRIAGITVSQATGSAQPSFNAVTGLTFAVGSSQFLKLASPALLTGAPGYTVFVFGSLTASSGANAPWFSYGQNGTNECYIGSTSSLMSGFLRAGVSNLNYWNTAISSLPMALNSYMGQGQWADGVTGQKAIQQHAVPMGGSRASAQDVSAGAFTATSSNMTFGCYNNSGSFIDGTIRHIVLLPSQISQGNINLIDGYLHTIEGV